MVEIPRKLTSDEISDIVSVIPTVQAGTADIALENHKRIIDVTTRQLSEIELKPSKIEKMKAIIYNRCMRSNIHPGDNVGLHASESMGQPISQINLNTFHQSGAAGSEGGGINDFKRVFSLIKNPNDRTRLFMSDLNIDMIDAMNLTKAFVKSPLLKLIKNSDVSTSITTLVVPEGSINNREVFGKHYELFEKMMMNIDPQRYSIFNSFKKEGMLPGFPFVRIKLDRYQLFYNRITTKDVAIAIESIGNVLCVFSPNKDAIVDVFMNSKSYDKNTKDEDTKEGYFDNEEEEADDSSESTEVNFSSVEFEKRRNLCVIFMQSILLPLIYSGNILINSSIISKTISKLSDDFDSIGFAERNNEIPIFGTHRLIDMKSISNYKVAEYRSFNILSALKGATIEPLSNLNEKRENYQIWNLWIDRYLINVNGTRFTTIKTLIELIFKSYEEFNFIKIDYDNEEFIRISLPSTIKSPIKHMEDVIKQNQPSELSQDDDKIFFRPRKPISDIFMLSKRFYIDLYDSESHTLNILRSIPIFDKKYTYVNNFHELYDNFGIECSRAAIISEIYALFKAVGSFINPVHIRLIADVMTSGGFLMPITARGVSNKHLGPYYDSSFEQALQTFKKAALWGKEERINTASSCVLFGSRCRFGTGSFKMRSTTESNNIQHQPVKIQEVVQQHQPSSVQMINPSMTKILGNLFNNTFPPKDITFDLFENGFSRLGKFLTAPVVTIDRTVTRGLKNIGNSCYFNSLIQLLANIDSVKSLFIGDEWNNFKSINAGYYAEGLHDIIDCLWNNDTVCNPNLFKSKLQKSGDEFFNQCNQEDPFEAYVKIMDLIQNDMRGDKFDAKLPFINTTILPRTRINIAFANHYSKFKTIYPSSLFDDFTIFKMSTVKWDNPDCKSTSKLETSNFLMVSLIKNETSLQTLIHEELGVYRENLECTEVGSVIPASVTTHIMKYPNILVIQLKRYSNEMVKNNISIKIDDKLNLTDYYHKSSIGTGVYRLKGIINHIGSRLDSGHYTTNVRNGNKWYELDDDTVRPLDISLPINSKEAYMVVYETI